MMSLAKLKTETSASIVTFLIALPLAMGIAVASGYPPAAGLITGIVGGILVGFISGSPLQVSGAAAGLTVLVFDGVQRIGIESMAVVIVLAGLLQIGAAAAQLGRWFQAVSPTVLYAMLAGIGILIVASQIHVMFDLAPSGSGLSNILAIPDSLHQMLTSNNRNLLHATGLGVLTIGTMILWPKGKESKLAKIPAPLAAVILASVVAWFGGWAVNFVSIPENILASWSPSFPAMGKVFESTIIIGLAIQLALIASAESLLCAGAVDQLHDGVRTKYNQELAAQGVGNAICGLLGALPMTGVIVRSSANIQAGAKTRLSTILHGCWLLLLVVMLPKLLNFVPIAALAGLLVFTGCKLVNLKAIREISKISRGELFTYATTVALIVTVDLLTGVLAGLALSGIRLLVNLSSLSITTDHSTAEEVVINLTGAATFLRLPKLSATLETLPLKSRIILKSKELRMVDHACVQLLETWRRRHIGCGGQVVIEEESIFAMRLQKSP